MKRLLITLLLALLAVAAVVLWRERPRLFPSSKVSDLYLRYEHNPHIRTTEIHDFRINDTLALDAFLLQATDSLGWETLKKDFNILPEPSWIQEAIDRGEDLVFIRLTSKAHPGQAMDTTDILRNNVMAVSRLHKTVSIFEINSIEEKMALYINQFHLE